MREVVFGVADEKDRIPSRLLAVPILAAANIVMDAELNDFKAKERWNYRDGEV